MSRHRTLETGFGLSLLLLLFSPVDISLLAAQEEPVRDFHMIYDLSFKDVDFNKIMLSVTSNPEFKGRLQARAQKHLFDAKLYTGDGPFETLPIGALEITLRADPIEGCAPPKFLYRRKVELVEDVVPVRTNIPIRMGTWFYGFPESFIAENMTIERLEADLDRLIGEFIRAYKMANPGR